MIHRKGGRPKLDITKISETSYVHDKILVKIAGDLERQFRHSHRKRPFKTGHTRFDDACKRHHPKSRCRLLDQLYEKDVRSGRYQHRHDQCGVGRWEEIELAPGTDIVRFIEELAGADGIEYVEPIYHKSLIKPTANITVSSSAESPSL